VAHIGNKMVGYRVLIGGGCLKEGDHLEDLDIDRWVILKCIFKMWDGEHGLV
jgi:hypothetical protein